MNREMIDQELYDATKAYQNWAKTWRMYGESSMRRREWYEIVQRLNAATNAAFEEIKEHIR